MPFVIVFLEIWEEPRSQHRYHARFTATGIGPVLRLVDLVLLIIAAIVQILTEQKLAT